MLRLMRVLTAVDFSPASVEAWNQAKAESKGADGARALCYVMPVLHEMTTLFPEEHQVAMLHLVSMEAELRQVITDRLVSMLGPDQGELFIERGHPYAELIRRADSWKADLVVVGSHGHTGLGHLLLGSVAQRVVAHAHCSVLVTRPAPTSGVVLVATDLSDPSLPAIRAAADEASRRGARLVVLSVVDWSGASWMAAAGGPFGIVPAVASVELQRESHRLLLEMLTQAIGRIGATGEPRVLEGSPATTIVECAKELQAELVVVGTHGRTGLARLALGSVAQKVIQTAPCPVLAVRHHKPVAK
jgi:nucleotide-binding universal stress UspA family protein